MGVDPPASTGSPDDGQESPSAAAEPSVPVPAPEGAPVASSAVVLRFDRSKRAHKQGVPARDLTEADLKRLVYVRKRIKPGAMGFKAEYNDFVSRLAASGLYERE
jgi:hypothetical protein